MNDWLNTPSVMVPTFLAACSFVWGVFERLRGYSPGDQALFFLLFGVLAAIAAGRV